MNADRSGDGAANDNDGVGQQVAANLGLSSPQAVMLHLEGHLALVADVLAQRASPAARAAAARLRAIDVAALLTLPYPEARALLRALLTSFRNLATALAVEDAAATSARPTQVH